jgi:3'-5' exoribonuclease
MASIGRDERERPSSTLFEVAALHEMQKGQSGDFFAVLSERVRRSTRDGKPYFLLRFRDQKRSASVPVWSDSPLFDVCEREWQVGQHFKIRALYDEHEQYGPQLEVQKIRLACDEDRADGYDPAKFVRSTRFDVEALFAELVSGAESIADEPLRRLVLRVLSDHEDAIREFPAASRNHHAYRGGYLEHTVSVLRTGLYFAEKYAEYYPDLDPPLNRDLVVAGCIVHDIGKVIELQCHPEGASYTVAGELIGHILIGRDIVRDAGRHVDGLNPELLLYLEHIITSHQGLAEWGSPKPPMLPEALLVHYADDVDAKMNIFVSILDSAEGDGPFTDQSNVLRRKLLKDRNK